MASAVSNTAAAKRPPPLHHHKQASEQKPRGDFALGDTHLSSSPSFLNVSINSEIISLATFQKVILNVGTASAI